jgi:very-short-patch-repair endonuclease
MMQGFIDEDTSKEMEEIEYLYPKIKWNEMNLRDKSNKLQMFIGLHDKKLISTQTLLEEFELDADQELQRLREEAVLASASGQLMGMSGGGIGGGGMMGGGMPGGMGGIPGGMPGGMPGEIPGGAGGMPGGIPGGGAGMPGGMPGGGAGGVGAPMGAPGGVAEAIPSSLKIGRRGKKGKTIAEQMQAPPPTYIKLTRLEQKMFKILGTLDVPYKLFGQFKVAFQGTNQPFVIDFAYPDIGVGCEVDGAPWHETIELRERDQERDMKLANIGWRILRFNESAIEERGDEVKNVIYQNIVEASKDKTNRGKKAETDEGLIKLASGDWSEIDEKKLIYKVEEIPNGLGKIFLIGL